MDVLYEYSLFHMLPHEVPQGCVLVRSIDGLMRPAAPCRAHASSAPWSAHGEQGLDLNFPTLLIQAYEHLSQQVFQHPYLDLMQTFRQMFQRQPHGGLLAVPLVLVDDVVDRRRWRVHRSGEAYHT